MNVTIKNFRGIAHADLMLLDGRVTLVTGANGAGKTSCAQAVAAAFSGEMPVEGVKKSEGGVLVRAGAVKGSVEVDCEGEGTITVSWPSGKVTTTGTPRSATVYALGLVDLTRLEPKKAAGVLLDYLKATPTRDDLVAALALQEFTPEQHAALWRDVENLGWDGAEKLWREKGQRLKGRWETIAGERYGPAKAETWAPAKWTTGLEGASEESLTAQLTQAREFLEAAIAVSAVSADHRERLEALAATLPALREQFATEDAEWKASITKTRSCEQFERTLPRPARDQVLTPCPLCAGHVVIVGSRIEKPAPVDAEADAQKRDMLARAAADTAASTQQMRDLARKVSETERQRIAAERAAAELATLPDVAKTSTAQELEHAREEVRRTEDDLLAFRAHRDARATHRSIIENDGVVEALKPDGLRLKKLRAAVLDFNAQLVAICVKAGWGRVRLDEGLAISYDDRPLSLVSASQRFRASVAVQLALAVLDRSAVVVIDAADILDVAGRNGLVKMLREFDDVAALVCMTMKRLDVPFNGGLSYWLEDGEAQQVKEVGR